MKNIEEIQIQLFKAYQDIFKVLTDSDSTIEDIADIFLEKCKQLTRSKYGYLNTIDPQTGIATSRTISRMMGKECHTEGKQKRLTFSPDKDGFYPTLWGVSLNDKKPFFTNSPEKHKSSKGVPKGHIPIKNYLSVPIIFENTLIGQIGLSNSENNFSEEDVELVSNFLDLYVIAVKRKEAEHEKETSRHAAMLKFNSVLTPEHEITKEEFKNIVNSDLLQSIIDDFYFLNGIPMTIDDLEGNLIVSAGWQEICTKFHRKNKDSATCCAESEAYFTKYVREDAFISYKCKNNLWDMVTPIIIGKKHMGNLFIGQFFFEDDIIDENIFIAQADKYGFDTDRYLEALHKVPKFSREKVDKTMSFYLKLTQLFSNLSYSNLKLAKLLNDYSQSRDELRKSYAKLRKTLDGTINSLSSIVETRDPYTSGHQKRVEELVTAIAEELDFDKNKIRMLSIAALVHDIGKIGIPASILSKPAKLTEIETKMVKIHPEVGYNILKEIDFDYPVAEIILQHHEKLDGTGYPKGLRAGEILFEAKILAVADAMEAMVSHRPHRPAKDIEDALKEVEELKNIYYDPAIADICIRLFREKNFKFSE